MERNLSSLDMRKSCFVIARRKKMRFLMSKTSWPMRLMASLLKWATMTPMNSVMV